MRLKLKNDDKIKIRFLGTLLVFLCSFVFLYSMSLNVHAEGAGSFPLPFGAGSNYGYGSYPLTSADIDSAISLLDNMGITPTAMFVYEIGSNNSYIDLIYSTTPIYVSTNNNGTFPAFNTPVLFFRQGANNDYPYGGIVRISSSGGSIVNSGIQLDMRIDVNNYLVNGVIPQNSYILYYPVFYNNNADILGYAWVGGTLTYDLTIFNYAGISGGGSFDGPGFEGSASGQLTPKSSVDGQGFDIDFDFFIDMNPLLILGEEIRDGIDTLTEKVEDGFDTVIGSLQGAWGWLKSNTDTIVSKIQELAEDAKKPTSQQLEDALDNSTVVGGMVDVAQSGKSFLDSLTASGIQVPSADDMDFDYTFTWKEYKPKLHSFRTHSSTIHIVFSWYESIRSKVLLVLGVFMTIGFTVYLIKQIPNLIAGVSGGASAGVSISEFNNNSKGVKK